MSTLTQRPTLALAALTANLWRRLQDIAAAWLARRREHARLRAEMRLLSELGDATLRDLGLTQRALRLPTERSTPDWTHGHW